MKEAIKRRVEKGDHDELSPMDPPAAFCPPSLDDDFNPELLHPFLQQLVADHDRYETELDLFAEQLRILKENGFEVTTEINEAFARFFRLQDEDMMIHHGKEEKRLFPLLHQRLIAQGEHSRGAVIHTPVNVMEDEHTRSLQLAAVAFNFIGLASRLSDEDSRRTTLEAAIAQCEGLVELMRLHIFRENRILYPMAQSCIAADEFDAMLGQ